MCPSDGPATNGEVRQTRDNILDMGLFVFTGVLGHSDCRGHYVPRYVPNVDHVSSSCVVEQRGGGDDYVEARRPDGCRHT